MADLRFLQQLKGVVLQRISDDDLVLPPQPAVMEAARASLRGRFDPDATAHALEADPLIAARVLRVASAGAGPGQGPIINLPAAVRRLGQGAVAGLLDELALVPVFVSPDEGINRTCRGIAEHLLGTATVARDLVLGLTGQGQEKVAEAAFLGGLMHDLGKPVLAALLLDAERRLRAAAPGKAWLSAGAFAELVHSAHRTVGLLAAARWHFPALVRKALADVEGYDATEPFSVPNVVRLANALCKRAGVYAGPQAPAAVARIIDEGTRLLSLPPGLAEQVCARLGERVRARLA